MTKTAETAPHRTVCGTGKYDGNTVPQYYRLSVVDGMWHFREPDSRRVFAGNAAQVGRRMRSRGYSPFKTGTA